MFRRKKNSIDELPALEPLIVSEDNLENEVTEKDISEESDMEEAAATEESNSPEETHDKESEAKNEQEASEMFKAALEAYAIGAGITTEEVERAIAMQAELAASLETGVFDADCMDFILKGMNFEREMERARNEGVIEGRNFSIAEAFRDLRLKEGNEVPVLGGTANIGTGEKGGSIFDVAKGAR